MFTKISSLCYLALIVLQCNGAAVLKSDSEEKGPTGSTIKLLEKLRSYILEKEKDTIDHLRDLSQDTNSSVSDGYDTLEKRTDKQLYELKDITERVNLTDAKIVQCLNGTQAELLDLYDAYHKNISNCSIGAVRTKHIVANATEKIRAFSYVIEELSNEFNSCGFGANSLSCIGKVDAEIFAEYAKYSAKVSSVSLSVKYAVSSIKTYVEKCVQFNIIQAEFEGKRELDKAVACINRVEL